MNILLTKAISMSPEINGNHLRYKHFLESHTWGNNYKTWSQKPSHPVSRWDTAAGNWYKEWEDWMWTSPLYHEVHCCGDQKQGSSSRKLGIYNYIPEAGHVMFSWLWMYRVGLTVQLSVLWLFPRLPMHYEMLTDGTLATPGCKTWGVQKGKRICLTHTLQSKMWPQRHQYAEAQKRAADICLAQAPHSHKSSEGYPWRSADSAHPLTTLPEDSEDATPHCFPALHFNVPLVMFRLFSSFLFHCLWRLDHIPPNSSSYSSSLVRSWFFPIVCLLVPSLPQPLAISSLTPDTFKCHRSLVWAVSVL